MAVRKCWKTKRFGRVGETDRSNKSKQNNSESSRVNYQEKKEEILREIDGTRRTSP